MATNPIYSVKEKGFKTFTEAVEHASSINAEVIQISNGLRRWAPAPKVSARRQHQYRNQKAAYEAQQRMNS